MAYQKPVMKVEMKDFVLIKPSKSRPSSILSLSTLDNRPDLNYQCHTVHVYRSPTHDSKLSNQLLDPALMVKEALSKALLYYYPLAGRLVQHTDGKFRMICSDAAEQGHGVPFIEAFANCKLSSVHYLDGANNDFANQLVFDLPTEDERGHKYPMVFKMTKFLCGGFTIGIGILHTVVDGSGASQFFRAIAELASGRSEPSVKPVWEREGLIASAITKQPLPCLMVIDKASAAVSPFVPTTVVTQICFKVNNDLIRRLKLGLMKECDEDDYENLKEGGRRINFTTFESLAAYVWRSRARALKQSMDGKTLLHVAVGARGRQLLDSPLPDGYYGNAIVDAFVEIAVSELSERPLSDVVKRIREAKNDAITRGYYKKFINTLETERKLMDSSLDEMGAMMALTEWKHLGFSDNDFGGYEAVNVVPVARDMFASVAMCVFSPPHKLDDDLLMVGGARIFITLPIDAVPKFREEMEALKLSYHYKKISKL